MRGPRALTAMALAIAMTLAACGDGDDTSSESTTPESATTNATDSTEESMSGADTTATDSAESTEPTDGSVSEAAPTSAAPAETAEGVHGGNFTYACTSDLPSLDFTTFAALGMTAAGCFATKAAVLFDLLMYEDSNLDVVGGTAESLTSTDGSTWTLTLRPGIEFSDGTPYDAEAVKFNWERIANPDGTASGRAVAAQIAEMEVVDAQTLSITLEQPNGQFGRSVARALAVIGSPTAIQELGDEGFAQAPVGAGPFVLKEWVRDGRLVFERNPNYWNAPLPYFDTVTFVPIGDDNQRANSLVSGDIDGLHMSDAVTASRLVNDEDVVYSRTAASGGRSFLFNTGAAPFDDVIARQAVGYAIDRVGFQQVIERDAGEVADGLFVQDSPFYDESLLSEQDLAKAQELLNEYADSHGAPLSFTILAGETNRSYTEFLQAQLSELDNIEVKVEIVANNQTQERMGGGTYEAGLYVHGFIDPEPRLSDVFASGAPGNWMFFNDPDMDAALAAGKLGTTPEERQPAYAEVQRIINDQVPWVLLSRYIIYNAMNPDLMGLEVINDGAPLLAKAWWPE